MSSPCCEWSEAIGALLNADMLFGCAWSSLKYVDVKKKKTKTAKLCKTAIPPQEPDLNSQTLRRNFKNGVIVRTVSGILLGKSKISLKKKQF